VRAEIVPDAWWRATVDEDGHYAFAPRPATRQSANLRCAAGLHDAAWTSVVPISPTGPVTFDSGSTDQPGNRCGVTASDIAVSLAVN